MFPWFTMKSGGARARRRAPSVVVALLAATLIASGCGGNDANTSSEGSGPPTTAEKIDYAAIGLWDDGPCDETKPPLKIGLMTVFESPVISLKDQADALESSATAFNRRGGANGSCIEVTVCDDKANADQAVSCVRTIDEAGVVATVNDQGTAAAADVSSAMQEARIPRVASNVSNQDWGDPNAYPLDASGTGSVFMQPQSLVNEGVTKIGLIRVDLAEAAALIGILEQIFGADAEFVYDTPVPAGTTDYSQFILGAQNAGADGVSLSIGEQEATQVVRAGQQLDTPLKIAVGLGNFSHAAISDLDDFATHLVITSPFVPATFDLPVYKALRDDLAASGVDALEPQNLKASAQRSWMGLYALLKMIRDAKMTSFTRDGITTMLRLAKDVPMLGMYGDADWTPNLDHPGLYKRAGIDQWLVYTFDPGATSVGLDGSFVEKSTISFDETLCDSALGGPC
jgi:ABC-type branched-subunit amino acid transport system substrate-binding protein